MKKIIEYVPIITVCLIYFGFCNLHFYYKQFNIDISNYVSNTEIIQSFLPSIAFIASTAYIYFYNKIINHSTDKEYIKLENKEKELIEKGNELYEKVKKIAGEQTQTEEIKTTKKSKIRSYFALPLFKILLLIIIQLITVLVLTEYFYFKNYELQYFNVIYAIFFLILVYYSSGLFENQQVINDNILLISFFTVLYIGNQIASFRSCEAEKIKDGIAIKSLVFKYNNKTIKTSKDILYIGQTQSTLFMYDKKNKSTLIYKNDEIDSLIILNK